MYGLTIRYSLHGTTKDVAERLRIWARGEGQDRFTGRPGLVQTIWTLREGGSFGATSVWQTAADRAAFLDWFRDNGSPVKVILGHGPDALEEFEVLVLTSTAATIQLPEQAEPVA